MNNPIISDEFYIQIVRFRVTSSNAETLLASIIVELDQWVSSCDGFISANFHMSEDGEHLINYAQWRDEGAFQAFTKDPRQSKIRDIISGANVENVAADGFILKQSITAKMEQTNDRIKQ